MRFLSLIFPFLFLSVSLNAQQSGEIKKRWGKYGYKVDGEWLIKPRYDSIRPYSENRAAVMKKGKWGFVDENGKMIIERQYHTVTDFHNGLAAVKRSDISFWNVLGIDGSCNTSYYYDTLTFIDSIIIGHWPAGACCPNGADIWKYPDGLIHNSVTSYERHDSLLLLKFPRVYDYQSDKTHAIAQVITTNGQDVTTEFFLVDSVLQKNVIITDSDNRLQAVLTADGRISDWYTAVTPLNKDHYKIWEHTIGGVMNSNLVIAIEPGYDYIATAGENYILGLNYKYILADSIGRQLSNAYERLEYLNDGFCYAKKKWHDSTYVLVNEHGDMLPGSYAWVFPFSEGIARVVKPGDYSQYSYIDTSGKQITPWYNRTVTYDESSGTSFGDFIFGVVRFIVGIGTMGMSEVLGWFDTTPSPREVKDYEKFPGYNSSFDYFYGTDFHNGLAINSVKRKPRWEEREDNGPTTEYTYLGVIDSNGKQIVKPIYDHIYIQDSLIVLKKNNNHSLVTRSGKVLIKPSDGNIFPLGAGCFSVQCGSDCNFSALYYFDGQKGKYLTSYDYRELKPGGDSMFIVKGRNGLYGFINTNGELVIPMIYFHVEPFQNGKAYVKPNFDAPGYYINARGER